MRRRHRRRKIRLCMIVVLMAGMLLGARYNWDEEAAVTVGNVGHVPDVMLGTPEKLHAEFDEKRKLAEEKMARKPKVNQDGTIAVESILQNPELPTGCEATSGAMLLQAYGYKAEKTDVAGRMKKGKRVVVGDRVYAGHPDEVFIGNPESGSGYGAFPKVLAEAMQRIIDEQGGNHLATPMYGKTQREILNLLDKGTPVCIWSSIGGVEIEYRSGWYLMKDGEYTDEYFTWPSNEHVLVLTGYDDDEVFVCDPLKGRYSYKMKSFFRHYEQVGGYTLILEEK